LRNERCAECEADDRHGDVFRRLPHRSRILHHSRQVYWRQGETAMRFFHSLK
jgi:hypothetical protein